jgi:hypothetical protein
MVIDLGLIAIIYILREDILEIALLAITSAAFLLMEG